MREQHLITAKEVSVYGRPMSIHMDEKVVNALIRESEDQDIKPIIGSEMFNYLVQHIFEQKVDSFLNGSASFCGLKTALAYYVQAKLIKANDTQITRFGAVQKEDQYSDRPSQPSKSSLYNDYAHIADNYLNECRLWLNNNKDVFPEYKGCEGLQANRTTFKVIGE